MRDWLRVMRDWLEDWWPPVVVGLLAAVVLTLGIVSLSRFVRRCTEAGGHIEQRNCHDVTMLTCMSYDKNMCTLWVPITSEACDTVCVGAALESR